MKTQKGATLVGSLIAITILSTTLVAVLNLQASIIRSKFFLQYDNTANLLVAEGLEIVRAIYADTGTVASGKYKLDFTDSNLNLATTSNCADTDLNNSCALDIKSSGFYEKSSTSKIFHRFITIDSNANPKVTSTVVVRNPKGGNLRVYKATIQLYKIED